MSTTNVAISTAVSIDGNEYEGKDEEKGSVTKSVQDEEQRKSATDGVIFMKMTVEQINESVEEARGRARGRVVGGCNELRI
jgi:hypothetical protein